MAKTHSLQARTTTMRISSTEVERLRQESVIGDCHQCAEFSVTAEELRKENLLLRKELHMTHSRIMDLEVRLAQIRIEVDHLSECVAALTEG